MTEPTLQWWLNLSFVEVGHYIALAEVAEECGFAGVVVSDHLLSPADLTSAYPYSPGGGTRWTPDADWPDCWVMIAAMAARTERIRFATSIYIAPLREPFALAKAIGTSSVVSGGRVVCGVGTGWMAEEFDAVGVPFAGRAQRLDEMLDVMTALWTGELVEHHGAAFDFPSVQMRPAPATAVPIYVGGHAERALQRAVRHDGWIAAHQTVETTVADVARVEAMLRAAGRDRASFAIMATISARRHIADSGGLAEAGVDAVAVPAAVIERHPDLDVKVAALRAFASEHIAPR